MAPLPREPIYRQHLGPASAARAGKALDEAPSLDLPGLVGSRAAGLPSLGQATWGFRSAGGKGPRTSFIPRVSPHPWPTPATFLTVAKTLPQAPPPLTHPPEAANGWAPGQIQAADRFCG